MPLIYGIFFHNIFFDRCDIHTHIHRLEYMVLFLSAPLLCFGLFHLVHHLFDSIGSKPRRTQKTEEEGGTWWGHPCASIETELYLLYIYQP